MLIVRADGNQTIGLGHVMRCLSIADAVKEQGERVLFVTVCEACMEMIRMRGHEVTLLDCDYSDVGYDMLAELPRLKLLCEQLQTKITFLVDSYQVSREYYRQLQELGRVACLEDMGQVYPVDLLINYNIYGADFETEYLTLAKSVLLGAAYTPLRREFQEDMEYALRDSVQNVLITTGGSDPFFASKAFVDAFLKNRELQGHGIIYHIVSGPMNRFAKELKEHFEGNESVIVHENVESMKALMKQCDIVLTATGSTIYEVSALGVPMICFYFAENQRRGAEAIERLLQVTNAGDFSKDASQVVERAQEALLKLIGELEMRKMLYRYEKALVDGKGAKKIAKALQELNER